MKKFLLLSSFLSVLLPLYIPVFAGGPGHSHSHGHGRVEVSSFTTSPTLSLEVLKDKVMGWNIHLIVGHFRFAPENVNTPPAEGEGHAHLFIDGKKVARLYSPWFHLKPLPKGSHTIRVTLNANTHADLVLHGKVIEAEVDIIQ